LRCAIVKINDNIRYAKFYEEFGKSDFNIQRYPHKTVGKQRFSAKTVAKAVAPFAKK
jgi:hypothetical protein